MKGVWREGWDQVRKAGFCVPGPDDSRGQRAGLDWKTDNELTLCLASFYVFTVWMGTVK